MGFSWLHKVCPGGGKTATLRGPRVWSFPGCMGSAPGMLLEENCVFRVFQEETVGKEVSRVF